MHIPLTTSSVLVLLLVASAAASPSGHSSIFKQHSCAKSKPLLSCSAPTLAANATKALDTCCVETTGGLFLATQFWSTYTGREKMGQVLPKGEWTIHGLWPDFCNGSYTQYCDLSRQYDPNPSPNTTTGKPDGVPVPKYMGPTVDTFLKALGADKLLAYMNKYWISQNEPNANLWAHEFSKHATCFSTFDTKCYPDGAAAKHADLLDFVTATVKYYQRLPTYHWLAKAGLTPSNSTHVSLDQLQGALKKGYGKMPYIGCAGPRWNETAAGKGSADNGYTVVSETWYYFHAYGRPQDGHWDKLDANSTGGSVSNCAKAPGAIRYPQRSNGSEV